MKNKTHQKIQAFAIAILLLPLLMGCQENVDPIPDDFESFIVKGYILDIESSDGIAGAAIEYYGQSTTSNPDGSFFLYIKQKPETPQLIFISKDSYAPNAFCLPSRIEKINIIQLRKLNPPITIGNAGGEISANSIENINPSNNKIVLNIPAGALNKNENISATYLNNGVAPGKPAYQSSGHHIASCVQIEPAALILQKEASLTFPLPVKMDSGVELPLLQYNEKTGIWNKSGIKGIVDESGYNAIAKIKQLGIFAIGIEGSYSEEFKGYSISIENYQQSLDKSLTVSQEDSLTITCEDDTIHYPDGFPGDVFSIDWAFNAVSQSTTAAGGLILDESCFYRDCDYVCMAYCECPLLPPPPDCDECYYPDTEDYRIYSVVYEYLTIRFITGEVLVERHLFNIIYDEYYITCPRWICVFDPDCHEGGGGNK